MFLLKGQPPSPSPPLWISIADLFHPPLSSWRGVLPGLGIRPGCVQKLAWPVPVCQ